MNTEIRIEEVNNPVSDWLELKNLIVYKKKLDYELFTKTFAATYAVLRDCINEASVDKRFIQLIMKANDFVNITATIDDDRIKAVSVLTERMLQFCTVDTVSNAEGGVTIYLLESQQEIYIDFIAIDDSVDKLACAFKRSYWTQIK